MGWRGWVHTLNCRSNQPTNSKAPDGFINRKVHKSSFKVSNFKKRLLSLWDWGVGKFFCHWASNPQNPNSLLSFLALHARDNQDRGKNSKSSEHITWQLLHYGEKTQALLSQPWPSHWGHHSLRELWERKHSGTKLIDLIFHYNTKSPAFKSNSAVAGGGEEKKRGSDGEMTSLRSTWKEVTLIFNGAKFIPKLLIRGCVWAAHFPTTYTEGDEVDRQEE